MKILPPKYFLINLFLIIVLGIFFPIKTIILPPYTLFGFVFVILGSILNLWTDNIFKIQKTTVKPNEKPNTLIMTGPFKISRHPMYLGMFLILLGSAIFLGKLVCFIFPVIFVILIQRIFIPIEEKNLEDTFKDKYIEYKKKTRTWI